MIEEKIQSEIEVAAQAAFPTSKFKMSDIEVSRPNEKGHGDFSTNIAFKLAGELKKSPKEIAEKLVGAFPTNVFEKTEAVNGFLNFYLKKEHYYQILETILKEKEKYANLDILKGKKIQVEFISSNPTGPPTLANGRGGYGGDVLSNVFAKAGAKVEREFYVNDYGNQMNILGNSVLIAAGLAEPGENYYRGDYIDKWAKDNIDFIKKNQNKPFDIGYKCSSYVLDSYIKPAVASMKIKFDRYYKEKELYDKDLVVGAVEFLDKKKLTYEADGAKWLKTSEFGDDKDRVIVKSNGDYTYMVPDVAYHWEKFSTRKYDLVVNILGADHFGYTARMHAAIGALGYSEKLRYLLTQMVRLVKDGTEFKMSKRKGVVVTIPDLFELIGGTENEASDVARFFFLMRSFNTHMDFDLDMAKERSDKNPVFYVKYAYARICSILAKSTSIVIPAKAGIQKNDAEGLDSSLRWNDGGVGADLTLLIAPQELELIDQMSQLPQLIASLVMFDEYPVHYLTFYAIDLAKKFHVFYDKCRVIDEENLPLTSARLELVKATQIVLGIVMRDLIGIDAPEKM